MQEESFEVRTLGGDTKRVPLQNRHVVGDTPVRGKHLIYDSLAQTITEVHGGMAFAIGVAVMEADTVRDPSRFWQVQHPNGVTVYHVSFVITGVAVTKVSG